MLVNEVKSIKKIIEPNHIFDNFKSWGLIFLSEILDKMEIKQTAIECSLKVPKFP